MTTKRCIAIILFSTLFVLSGMAQKELPPGGGKPKDFKLPKKENFTLKNGLSVTMVEYGTIPKVTIAVAIQAGNIDETSNEVWLADLTGDLLKEGTLTKSAAEISQEAADMGGSVDVSVGPDQTIISGTTIYSGTLGAERSTEYAPPREFAIGVALQY